MREKKVPPKFWTEDNVEEATRAADNKSYVFLGAVALRILSGMQKDYPASVISIVCGAITNGGMLPGAEVKKNLERFEDMIQQLELREQLVFNQLPFEDYLFQIRRTRPPEDPDILLNEFYRPIFESNIIDVAYFLPGWEMSHGATWEYNLIRELGMLYHLVRL